MQPPPPGIASNRGPGAPRLSSRLHYLRRFRPVLGRGSAPVGAGLRPSLLLQTPEERGGQPLPAWRTGSPGRALGRERKGSWCPRLPVVFQKLESWFNCVYVPEKPTIRKIELYPGNWKKTAKEGNHRSSCGTELQTMLAEWEADRRTWGHIQAPVLTI